MKCVGCWSEAVYGMMHPGPLCWGCRRSYLWFLDRNHGRLNKKEAWFAEREEELAAIWGGTPW